MIITYISGFMKMIHTSITTRKCPDNPNNTTVVRFGQINAKLSTPMTMVLCIKRIGIWYTLKQLLLICGFGMTTGIRQSKLKKDDVIERIIWFESQIDNGSSRHKTGILELHEILILQGARCLLLDGNTTNYNLETMI